MSSAAKPRFWLFAAAGVMVALTTLRVVTADATPRSQPRPSSSPYVDVADPALDALIHRFAVEAASARTTSR